MRVVAIYSPKTVCLMTRAIIVLLFIASTYCVCIGINVLKLLYEHRTLYVISVSVRARVRLRERERACACDCLCVSVCARVLVFVCVWGCVRMYILSTHPLPHYTCMELRLDDNVGKA